jgi:uncharacterized membrane protein YhaH (DUF805 family)
MDTPLVKNYRAVLQKYADFTGRATRSEYWYFALGNLIINIVLSLFGYIGDIVSGIYGLAVIIPGLAVGARRLHDTNKSGWWLLLVLIPIIGWIILIVWTVIDSDAGTNKYGPNPKGTNTPAAPAAAPSVSPAP